MKTIKHRLIWCWGQNDYGETAHSITRYVEDNSKRIRSKYISFIHDIGETVYDGKRLIEHMEIKPGFSLWWMSTLSEKSVFKSPHIVDCLKLIALEEVIKEERPRAIKVVGVEEPKVTKAIEILSHDLKTSVTLMRNRSKLTSDWSMKRLYYMLPHILQGLISLMRNILSIRPLRRSANLMSQTYDQNSVFICSYFDNINQNAIQQGRFKSNYWTELPDFLHNLGKRVNWLHLFILSKLIPDVPTGIDFLKRSNTGVNGQSSHSLLQGQLSFNVVTRAIRTWLRIITKPIKLKRIEQAIQKHRTAVFLWPLLKEDWKKSTFGATAIRNALWVELFEVTLSQLPRQPVGLYLYEGQSWERAFIYAWRKHGHGKLIAVPHAPSRFWIFGDLIDPREMPDKQLLAMPKPDRIAVNGPAAWDAFLEAGYSPKRLVPVEALRYLGFNRPDSKGREFDQHIPLSVRRLLVLGDITPTATQAMLKTMDSLPEEVLSKMEIIVKPHPNNPVQKSDYPDLHFKLIDAPLSDILKGVDIVYGSSPTSANLDALLAGLPVIIHQAEGQLNFSPLRGQTDVRFISSAEELESALQNIPPRSTAQSEEYFWLDKELPRWQELLRKY